MLTSVVAKFSASIGMLFPLLAHVIGVTGDGVTVVVGGVDLGGLADLPKVGETGDRLRLFTRLAQGRKQDRDQQRDDPDDDKQLDQRKPTTDRRFGQGTLLGHAPNLDEMIQSADRASASDVSYSSMSLARREVNSICKSATSSGSRSCDGRGRGLGGDRLDWGVGSLGGRAAAGGVVGNVMRGLNGRCDRGAIEADRAGVPGRFPGG